MGSFDQENGMDTERKIPLMDILYKDTYRIDSYLAQITNGTLRGVKLQIHASQGSSRSIKGSIKIASFNKGSKKLSDYLQEQNIDPHDHSIIELMNILDLPIYDNLPEKAQGALVHIHGQLSIRDFNACVDIVPFMAKNRQLFNIEKQEATNVNKMFSAITKFIPMNIEAELSMSSGEIVRGILKRDAMLDSYKDIASIYGVDLPGDWDIVGILDTGKPAPRPMKGKLRAGLDQLAAMAKLLYDDQSSNGTIIPILIFRCLEKG